MRKLLLLLLLIPLLNFSQKNISEKTDSVNYYLDLVKFHKRENNFKECLKYSQKALQFSIKIKNEKSTADCYSNLGSLYLELNKSEDAIDVLNKSIQIYSKLPESSELAFAHYNLGICYMENYNTNLATYNFNEAESIYKKLKISSASEMIDLQRGIIYSQKRKYDLALPLFESIITKKDTSRITKIRAEAFYQVGEIEIEKKRYSLALNYIKKAYSLNKNNLEQKSRIVLALSSLYEKTGNINKSFLLLKENNEIQDSILYQIHSKIGLKDFKEFKNSEEIRLIEQFDKESKSQQKANTFAKLISILAIALISILSLLSLSLYKNNIIRNQSNILLKDKNIELQIAKENAKKASKARAEFLSTVSHELRTPLNAINGITHLLIEENPKDSQIQYLNSLKFSGNYLLHFINDILEINRIESENIPIEKINTNLRSLLQNIQNSFKEIATENNNTFIMDIDPSIPENLICDPTKMSQIFMNLINNSLKFTKNGYVKLSAKLEESKDKNLSISFKVADNGIGIPEDKQESIFDSFSQGSIEINRKYGGTGLGLAIVKKLIELLGGSIYLNSKVGLGTTFSFVLPFEVGEEVVLVTEKVVDRKNIINKKILLVEDNKINQMITKKMLENKKMQCQIVDNGEDAVEIMKVENEFDLILMDVHLPGINGTIATQQIREFNTTIPIIALTAISLNENREMLLSFGMNDVITKPFEPEKFYELISKNLS